MQLYDILQVIGLSISKNYKSFLVIFTMFGMYFLSLFAMILKLVYCDHKCIVLDQ